MHFGEPIATKGAAADLRADSSSNLESILSSRVTRPICNTRTSHDQPDSKPVGEQAQLKVLHAGSRPAEAGPMSGMLGTTRLAVLRWPSASASRGSVWTISCAGLTGSALLLHQLECSSWPPQQQQQGHAP